jgi:hypothetical protein
MSTEEKLEVILSAFSMFLSGGLSLAQLRKYVNKIHPVDLGSPQMQKILAEARGQ